MVYYHPHTDSITAKNDVGGIVWGMACFQSAENTDSAVWNYDSVSFTWKAAVEQRFKGNQTHLFHCYNWNWHHRETVITLIVLPSGDLLCLQVVWESWMPLDVFLSEPFGWRQRQQSMQMRKENEFQNQNQKEL